MKKIAKTITALIVILSLLIVAPGNKAKAQFGISISLQTFYSELSPYGQWVDDPQYGYIWIPDAEPGFRPYYSRGHWAMTSYGAMWVSNYSWGWAPFHYGRWVYTSYYGWVWIPDTIWGPAWVSWRWGGDYCGWAPLGPGINLSISFGNGYSVPNDWWVFVPQRYCLSASFYNYRIAPERNITYIRNTTIINNTYVNNNITYVAGPRINDIERATGNKISVYNVANVSRPGKTSLQGNAVRTYRPQITKGNAKPPAVVTRDQFTKNKEQRNAGVLRNNAPGRIRQQEKKQIQELEQNNNRQVMPERRQQTNQPPQQMESRQMSQQNNNRQVMPERHQQTNQPPQQMESRQMPQQNNNRQVMPERRQQTNQPPQQMEHRQMPQQNNNRQVMPERRQQTNQPPPQQKPQQSKPAKKGKGNN